VCDLETSRMGALYIYIYIYIYICVYDISHLRVNYGMCSIDFQHCDSHYSCLFRVSVEVEG